MTDSSAWSEAQALSGNLGAEWNGGREILQALVEAAGDPEGNPWRSLQTLGADGVERLFADPRSREQLDLAFQRLNAYLAGESWFDRAAQSGEAAEVDQLQHAPVAYFCAEFGLVSWLQLYSGGLGILAGDILKESSDLGLPMVGVGLFYRRGFFNQRLDASDYQTEAYPTLDPQHFPLTSISGPDGRELRIEVPLEDRLVYARLWRLCIGRTALYLLDTDVPENDREEDRQITAHLYGGGQDTRIQQEIVLGVGGVRALRALGIQPSVYSMNEGHAAFLGVELLAECLQRHTLEESLAEIRTRTAYTNHTVVPAGNDVFPRDLVSRYLSPYAERTRLGSHNLLRFGSSGGTSDNFSMAELAFHMAGKANAVSQLHAAVIPREWPGYQVEAVTNGVHVPSWLGSPVTRLLERYVPDWRSDSTDWSGIDLIPAAELWAAKAEQRQALIDFVSGRTGRQLSPKALTIVWARRFAEYKRAWLLASDVGRLSRLLTQTEMPVQIIVSGKAHPRDDGGKRILQELLHRVEGETELERRVVFVEDYNIEAARYLVAGADVWLNTPRKPLEASGTSGMKAGDNGTLQLTVKDGWAAEVEWYGVGWGIDGRTDELDALDLYAFLEGSIIPTYFDRDANDVPLEWVAMMKRTMQITLPRYSARRMLLDYVHKLYVPLLREQQPVTDAADR